MKPKSVGLVLLATAVYAVVFYTFYGVYDDTRDIAYRTALMRGDFTGMPIGNLFIYFVGIAQPISVLLHWFPQVSLVGGLLVLLHLFTVAVAGMLLNQALQKIVGLRWFRYAIVGLMCSLIFSEAFFYLSIACSCMMAAVAAVLLWLWVEEKIQSYPWRWFIKGVCVAVLVVAVLTQNEVTLVATVCLYLFLLLCHTAKWRVAKTGLSIGLFYMFLYAFIRFSGGEYKMHFLRNETYLFTYYDTYFSKANDSKDLVDSIKSECMQHWFVWDKQQFNPAFFEKLTAVRPMKDITVAQLRFKVNLYLHDLYIGLFTRLLPLLLLNIFCVLAAVYFLKNRRQLLWQLFVYKLLLFAFFSVLCIVLKFEFRLLHSVFAIDTLLSFVFVLHHVALDNFRNYTAKLLLFVFVVLLIGGCKWKHDYYLRSCGEQILSIQKSKAIRTEIDSLFHGKQLVPSLDFLMMWENNSPLKTQPITANNTVLGYDAGYTTYYKEFDEWLLQNCGGDDFKAFIKYTWQHRDQAVFVSSQDKIDLWQRYLLYVYRTPVRFEKIREVGVPEPNKNTGAKTFAYYRISGFEVHTLSP